MLLKRIFKLKVLFFFYSLVACAHTYYGLNCNLTCGTLCFNQTCDAKSGECLKVTLLKPVILFYDGIRSGSTLYKKV